MNRITNHKSQIANWIDAAALLGVIVLAAVRLLVTFRNVWTWDIGGDMPVTDVGPIGTAVSDGLCVVTLAVAVIGAMIGRRKLHAGWLVLWLCGAAGAMMHVWLGTGDLFMTGSWIGGTALGLAAVFVAQTAGGRRMVLAAVMALGAAIGMEAVWQVTVQHQWTVQNYREHKQEVLQQHQWQEGSIEQQKFETRLLQNEATGAIGLSNVFGTAAGAVALLGAGWVMAGWKSEDEEQGVEASDKRMRRRVRWAVGACAALGAIALVCTFSKGAIASAGFVAGVFAVTAWIENPRRRSKTRSASAWWRNVAFFVVMLAVAAVIGRWWVLGIQTSAGGERSLLFRGFYWQAAAKMVEAEPITGIGPGRFQDEYMVMKNPLSPEDVADPHNVEVSWVSQLGLAGWAWVLMVGGMLWKGAPGSAAAPGSRAKPQAAQWVTAIVAGALAFGTQYVVQFAEMLPETAIMWVVGAVLFVVVVGYAPAMRLNERWLSIGALAGATVALLHSQIDMGLTNVGTMPVLMVVIGAAAANQEVEGVEASSHRRWVRGLAVALTGVTAALLVVGAVMVNDAAMMHEQAMMRLRAYGKGDFAAAAMPSRLGAITEPRVVNVMGSAALMMAERDASRQGQWLRTGMDHYLAAADHPMHRAAIARGQAAYDTQAWRITGQQAWHDLAIKAIDEALALDPYGTRVHIEMGEMLEQLGDREAASGLYDRALKLDEMKYLDPDSQLSADQRKELQQRIDR